MELGISWPPPLNIPWDCTLSSKYPKEAQESYSQAANYFEGAGNRVTSMMLAAGEFFII
jgi:hypothetical protein